MSLSLPAIIGLGGERQPLDNRPGIMTEPLWVPTPERVAKAQLTGFMRHVNERHGLALASYAELHRWSVSAIADFWRAIWDYCGVRAAQRGTTVVADLDRFPGARWFPEARLNFADNLLSRRDDHPALVALLENGERRCLSYADLYVQTARLAAALRRHGVVAGDRVAACLPNIPEAVIAMLATVSLGAIWSSCSPDFGSAGILDRFSQIEPKILFGADGYYYGGKFHSSIERLAEVTSAINSIEKVIVTPVGGRSADLGALPEALWFEDVLDGDAASMEFVQSSCLEPLFVLYSSGTTGRPKCILHGAGVLLQHLKEHRLQVDLRSDDVFFYFTTTGWMMWNWLISGLASGATLVLYDGSPLRRRGKVLLDLIDAESISIFGASARYIGALEKYGLRPRMSHSLARLRTILSTGSPLSSQGFEYIYRDFKTDVCLSSISGGTDILACFVGGCPILPVYSGEIQAPGLGMAVEFWDDQGRPLRAGKGELVCTRPFPSAPLGFWNDPDGARYRAAYFDRWPGVWAHGDYGEINDRGGVIIHGRSDATLNPGGVRIGTAEIYRQVEKIEEVQESIAVAQEVGADVRIVLFVTLAPGISLDDSLCDRIRAVIRANASPRHVPARIVAVPDVPRTISGKLVELAVRDVIHGRPVGNLDALANPEALDYFRNLPEIAL